MGSYLSKFSPGLDTDDDVTTIIMMKMMTNSLRQTNCTLQRTHVISAFAAYLISHRSRPTDPIIVSSYSLSVFESYKARTVLVECLLIQFSHNCGLQSDTEIAISYAMSGNTSER